MQAKSTEREDSEPVTRNGPTGDQRTEEKLKRGETSGWKAHEFTIVKVDSHVLLNRKRTSVNVTAPSALTPDDRIATLIQAGLQVQKSHNSHVVFLYLLPFDHDPPPQSLARVDFAWDGCGISGDGRDCTGSMWTAAHATDAIYKPIHKRVHVAWHGNRDKFMEDTEYGDMLNEDRLKNYMQNELGISAEEISEYWAMNIKSVTANKIDIPDHLQRLGGLTEQEQNEQNCRVTIGCWGEKFEWQAESLCPRHIERRALYDYEWTDGFLGRKFDRMMWRDVDKGLITFFGSELKFQNVFGAWQRVTYKCTFDTLNEKVVGVEVLPRS